MSVVEAIRACSVCYHKLFVLFLKQFDGHNAITKEKRVRLKMTRERRFSMAAIFTVFDF